MKTRFNHNVSFIKFVGSPSLFMQFILIISLHIFSCNSALHGNTNTCFVDLIFYYISRVYYNCIEIFSSIVAGCFYRVQPEWSHVYATVLQGRSTIGTQLCSLTDSFPSVQCEPFSRTKGSL